MTQSSSASVERLKAKLDEWDAQIDKLEAQARQKKAETKISYHQALSDLRSLQ